MDLESLYYFRELTKDLNMTRTAHRLFLSQQTCPTTLPVWKKTAARLCSTGSPGCLSPRQDGPCSVSLRL